MVLMSQAEVAAILRLAPAAVTASLSGVPVNRNSDARAAEISCSAGSTVTCGTESSPTRAAASRGAAVSRQSLTSPDLPMGARR